MRRWIGVAALLLPFVLVVTGCMAGGGAEASAIDYGGGAPIAGARALESAPESSGMMALDEEMVDSESSIDDGVARTEALAPSLPVEERAERMRVFSATVDLSVGSVERTREELFAIVEESGGYIESAHSDYLVLRVPASHFDAIVDRIETLGEVLSRSIESADVTDQFVDLERRLEIARAARERLYELLDRTDDSDEQVEILREIRRLTEEIEQISSRLESLGRLVAYSRITVQLRPRLTAEEVLLERIPFPWIAALDPLYPTIGKARRRFEGELPADFALFSEGRLIRAESADGVRVRAGALENEPEGDSEFWREALLFHRGPAYAEAERIESGGFVGVSFESRDSKPYTYWVLVHVDGRALIVAEVFFPTAESLEAHRADLFGWLEEVVQ